MLELPQHLERAIVGSAPGLSLVEGRRLRDRDRSLVVFRDKGSQFTESRGDFFEHRSSAGERDVLVQPRHAKARRPPDGPGVRRHVARHHFQQAGFPGSIAPDERDALPGLNLERGVLEERQVSEGERNGIEGEQGQC